MNSPPNNQLSDLDRPLRKWGRKALDLLANPLSEHVWGVAREKYGERAEGEIDRSLERMRPDDQEGIRHWSVADGALRDESALLKLLSERRSSLASDDQAVFHDCRAVRNGRNAISHQGIDETRLEEMLAATRRVLDALGCRHEAARVGDLLISFSYFARFPFTLSAPLHGVLFLVPCSAHKETAGGTPELRGPSILGAGNLERPAAEGLKSGRDEMSDLGRVDERRLLPAHQRYADGSLWGGGGEALLERLLTCETHLLILSGAYGVLLWDEPIGFYDLDLERARWPQGVLAAVLESYTRVHGIKQVVGFGSSTRPAYLDLMRTVDWPAAGVEKVDFLTAMTLFGDNADSDRPLGMALAELLTSGAISREWLHETDLHFRLESR